MPDGLQRTQCRHDAQSSQINNSYNVSNFLLGYQKDNMSTTGLQGWDIFGIVAYSGFTDKNGILFQDGLPVGTYIAAFGLEDSKNGHADSVPFTQAGLVTTHVDPVPIPGALPLFGSGLVGLTYLGRRFKRKQAPATLEGCSPRKGARCMVTTR